MRTFINSRVAGVVLSATLLLAGGALSIAQEAGASSNTKSASITIHNFMFMPMKITVTPGETIKVTNKDQVAHTLTASNGKFNTGDVNPGQTKTFKAPTKPGTYDYICSIHQYMTGKIVVK